MGDLGWICDGRGLMYTEYESSDSRSRISAGYRQLGSFSPGSHEYIHINTGINMFIHCIYDCIFLVR